ncbi:hypothetical protein BJP36_14775 [Moorena producens JHB]|uniref:Uncharacterized protein n=1 Tax=Moorena producens (strain JHB) TaxID=1454205 RepID=A0A1D9G0P7_MOOP1|nr:hypothetical protein [Moorena producens]AOY80980.2 hypothetical protein BJP36_14775 [Moorena producens JHB]
MKFSIVFLTGLMGLVPLAPVNAESGATPVGFPDLGNAHQDSPIVVGDSNRDVVISSFGRKHRHRSHRRHRRIYYPRRGRGRGRGRVRIYSPRRGGVRIYSPRRGRGRVYSPRRRDDEIYYRNRRGIRIYSPRRSHDRIFYLEY